MTTFLIITLVISFIIIGYLSVSLASAQKSYKSSLLRYSELIHKSLYSIIPQIEIILALMVSLEGVMRNERYIKLKDKFQRIKREVWKIRKNIVNIYQFWKKFNHTKEIDFKELNQLESNLDILNKGLYKSSIPIIGILEEFSEFYLDQRETLDDYNTNMFELIFYVYNLAPILSDFSLSSNEMFKKVIKQMVSKFDIVSELSQQMTKDIKNTMLDLMNVEKENSLAFVVKKALDIVADFDNCYKDMQKFKDDTKAFIEKSISKLSSISDITESIEEIAETVKVISLNVSVEAANTGISGRGFQVLARDLRELAYRTLTFAKDVKDRVNEAIITSTNLKEEYMSDMEQMYKYVFRIKASLEAYSEILNKTFDQIQKVVKSLEDFSHKIETGIQNVVNQFQNYDVQGKEVEHISKLIKDLLERFYSSVDQTIINQYISEEKRQSIRRDIIESIRRMISDDNERSILEKYEISFGLKKAENSEYALRNVASMHMEDEKSKNMILN